MIRKLIIVGAVLCIAPSLISAQGFRIGDNATITSSLTAPGVISTLPATINVCNSPANAVPCTNKATTFTSVTLATPCSTSTQVVLAGTSVCVANTDSRGNWGAWVAAGNYDFTVTVTGGNSFGPFTLSVGIPAGSVISPLSAPFSITGTGTVNTPTFNVAQTGAINTAGTLNGITEGCPLQANAVWNITLNINQCDAAGAAVTSLPLYVQANPTGNQTGNTALANWSEFATIKCGSFTGNPAFLNCQGIEGEAQYTGPLAVPNNLNLKGTGGQVYIDNTTTSTTGAVPVGISLWGGAPFYAYGACGGSCGTGSFVYAIGVQAEQPTASDSKGNAVGTGSRAALRMASNFTNDPVVMNWDPIGGATTRWQLLVTANPTAQPYDFALQNTTSNSGFRFQNAANGNAYIKSSGSGAVIFNGNPTFSGEGATSNGTGGVQIFPGGASGSLCNMATTGILNFCSNNATIRQRNSGNTLDERIIGTDAFDDVFIGDANISVITLNGHGGIQIQNPIESTGVVPTLTGTGACSTTSAVTGGSFSGSASCTAATAASTLTITFTPAAAHGYICNVQDETTRANLFQQTSHTTTTCVLTITSVTQNDVFVFTGIGF